MPSTTAPARAAATSSSAAGRSSRATSAASCARSTWPITTPRWPCAATAPGRPSPPRPPVPDLAQGCEEVTFLELPLTEAGRRTPLSPKVTVPPSLLVDEVTEALPAVAEAHGKNARRVEEQHQGSLYRADFRLCGYR